jgi:non-canonical purine NTP pyrophosphatase (RdgB/HAM1 family)
LVIGIKVVIGKRKMTKLIQFVTTNEYKFHLAKTAFDYVAKGEYELVQATIETPEIQSVDSAEIAQYSAKWASQQLGKITVVSDVAFEIASLHGFPGPFVKYINNWLQPDNILQMMKGQANREACYVDVLACATPTGKSFAATDVTLGRIVDSLHVPDYKWTVDALFMPEGHSKTLSEMSDEERDKVWKYSVWLKIVEFIRKIDE